MKIAYFDCFSGIAGDMALAALLDVGVPLDELKAALSSLPVEGWNIESQNVLRSGIHAQSVSISLHGQTDEDELAQQPARENDHHHAHDEHHHEHEHEHAHDEHEHQHHHGRSMREIRELIESSDLSARVKRDSLAVFEKIAVAEAYLHHSTPEGVHFHEIGGLDSLLDIVGVAWCLERLGIDAIYSSALPLSSGWVDCAHGKMPVPAPATLEILKGAPWTPTDVRGELVTPTGAGILAALCKGFGGAPAMTLEQIGLGAGKKDFADRPNILRISIGQNNESAPVEGLEWKTLTQFEANIDDLNPQTWELVFERLFAVGALDVWLVPIAMKKGRPAQMLGVLCQQSEENIVLETILRETTTLGARRVRLERASLAREMARVDTHFGSIAVKIAHSSELGVWRAQPEWDEVKRAAQTAQVPAREVFEAALRAASELKTVRELKSKE